ncbi:MAG: hypothetical protein PHD48_02780 [Alphaproteobacteria bacterium]|nr:hypothetical protein [Alphaproteobacteria bacterium]
MNQRIADQLEKILALTDSDHEGEALGALRMVRRLLEREGISFAALAQVARRGASVFSQPSFSGAQVQLEAKIDQLMDEIDAHVEQNSNLSSQIDTWRRRSFELEQMLAMNQSETTRWKEIARETAERLWDLGQIARSEAFVSPYEAPEDESLSDLTDVADEEEPLKAAG